MRKLHKHRGDEVTGTEENYGTGHFIHNTLQALPLSRWGICKKKGENFENVIIRYQSVPCG
jgi:hypothetical protein